MKKEMNRRDFLRRSLMAAAGVAIGGSALSGLMGVSGCAEKKRQQKKIGIQLWSLREMMKEDPKATLKLISEMGYGQVETAGYNNGMLYGMEPAEFGDFVRELGMEVSGCHTRIDWNPENADEIWAKWEKTLDDQAAAGCRYVFMSSMPVPETLAGLQEYVDYYNKVGEMANRKGLVFGFHNHAKEFTEIEGEMMYDYLVAHTDPDKVAFEMDVYWVQKGGQSPVEYLQKYPGRFPVLHIKDEDIIGNSGELDFNAIFDAAYAQGMKDFYVEIEKYPLPAEICAQQSFDYLDNAQFVK